MIEKISLEVNIPKLDSIICDASLKFEVKGTRQTIKNFEEAIVAEMKQECHE